MSKLLNKFPKVVLLTGKARSGKDTAAEVIYRYSNANLNKPAITLSLAEPLRRSCRAFFNISDRELSAHKEVPLAAGISPRMYMQEVGATFRANNPNTFSEIIDTEIINLVKSGTNTDLIIIPDCRYDDEITYFKDSYRTVCIKIERPSGLPKVRDHHSEAGVSDSLVDITITNDSSLSKFRDAVLDVIENWRF